MIDIMSGTEVVGGADTKRGHGMLWGLLIFVLVVAAAAAGVYAVREHYKPVVVDAQASIAAVKAADTAWAKAAKARKIEDVLSYYADAAMVLPPNQEMATDKPGIRKAWEGLLVTGTDVSWTPGSADVSSSGDLVYLEGYYLNTTTAGKGKPSMDRGKYLSVWKLQADGSWKCVADAWSSDLAAKK